LTDKPQSPTLRLVPSAPISAEMLAAIGRKAA
jgi:hypothetical protein